MHETIAGLHQPDVEPLDWHALRDTLSPAVEGPPFVTRRRTIGLSRDIVASVTLEEWTSAPEPDPDVVETAVRFGSVRVNLTTPWRMVQALLDAHGLDQDCESLPVSVVSMVAEHVLAPLMKPLEKTFGGDCRIGPEWRDPTADTYMCLIVALDGQSHRIVVATQPTAADKFLKLFPAASPLTRIKVADDMAIPLALRAPDLKVPAGILSQFQPGDVLMPQKRWPVMTQGVLMSGTHILGDVDFDPETQTPTLGALAAPDLTARIDDMTPTETLPRSATSQAPARGGDTSSQVALENLNVTVSVELSRSELPLGELRKLTIGTVLPFEGALGEPVKLLANGGVFASGELVRIGERIGVRLTTLD